MKYQVTLICENGKYKPVSTIVEIENPADKATIQNKGITKICITKRWDKRDLKTYGYTKVKCRVYDPEKIAKQNAERYAKLKEEKYASGEWKRPKSEQ